jgi:hypothetical protein
MTIIDSPKVESGGSVQGVRPAVIGVWLFWWGFVDLDDAQILLSR